MIEEFEVAHESSGRGGRYVIRLPDASEAELTYRRIDATTVIADHTGVPPQHRNKGLALMLVERLIADAGQEGFRVVPQCSYVAAQFRRHPDWSELRA